MITLKKGGVSLSVYYCKIPSDVAVSISFPAKVCSNSLEHLRSITYDPTMNLDAIIAYSLWNAVDLALKSDPLAVKGSKVGDTEYNTHNGRFYINFNVKGTVSAVRKSLGLALKALQPAKMYSSVQLAMKNTDMKYSREEFNYVANKMISSMRNGLSIGVIGNIRLGKATSEHRNKLEKMLDVVVKKFNPVDVSGKKKETTWHHGTAMFLHDKVKSYEVKVSGWKLYVLYEYLRYKLRGVQLRIKQHGIEVIVNNFEKKIPKLKKDLPRYVELRLKKLGKDLGCVLAYAAISNGILCFDDVSSIVGATTNDLVGSLNKLL